MVLAAAMLAFASFCVKILHGRVPVFEVWPSTAGSPCSMHLQLAALRVKSSCDTNMLVLVRWVRKASKRENMVRAARMWATMPEGDTRDN